MYDFTTIQNIIQKGTITEELKEKIIHDFNEAKGNYYAYFRNLIKNIGVENFLKYYDFKKIHAYFQNKHIEYEEYKLLVCLLENEQQINHVITYALTDSFFFDMIFQNQNQMYSIFSNIDYTSLVQIIKKIENENWKYDSTFLRGIEHEKKIMLLSDTFKEETIWWMLPNLSDKEMEYFFTQDKRAPRAIEENHISVPYLIDMNMKLSKDILYNQTFFEKIKSVSLVEFRRRVSALIETNPSITLIEKTKKYEEEMLNQYDPKTKMFNDYNNLTLTNLQEQIDKSTNKYISSYKIIHDVSSKQIQTEEQLKIYLQKETSRKISDIIIDLLFQDNYYNVMINIAELLRYQSKNNMILNIKYIKLYELLGNIDELPNDKKIELYQHLKDKNISTMFYEHLRKYKDDAYTKMISKLFTLDAKLLNQEQSKKLDVLVYELKGEPFTMMVRGMNAFHPSSTNKRDCYSLIDNTNIEVIPNYDYYYGYYHIDKNKIMHVFENDSYSVDLDAKNTKAINRIMTKEEITNVQGYSEIQIANEKIDKTYYALKPDYLVVFNLISEKEIKEAKRLNIPIIKIESEKYQNKSKEPSHMFDTDVNQGYQYIETEEDERNILIKSKIR
jgi:hypothetical protein